MPLSRPNEVVSFRERRFEGPFHQPHLGEVGHSRAGWNQNHVIYVWFDALVGYLTGIGFAPGRATDSFQKYWPAQFSWLAKTFFASHGLLACVPDGRWTGCYPNRCLRMAGG
jgi:methionyl-tRNA synthetase